MARAVALADAGGLASLSMRRLAAALRVEAMSLYHHLAGKEALLDAMVDAVFAEVALPVAGAPWQEALRARCASLREALLRHRWALSVLESRAHPGPATLRHHDAVLGALRGGGFTMVAAARAYALLDAYVYGFALQELQLPFRHRGEKEAVVSGMLARMEGAFPHLAAMAEEHVLRPDYAFADEFPHGLALVLDALERIRAAG